MRVDGRAKDEPRRLKIKRNYLKYAEGSCLIELGDTRVICTASVEDSVPPFLRNTHSGWVTAEYSMIPRSCKTRIQRDSSRGKTAGRTQEIQRLIGRSLRGIVDLSKLGERTIWLDADVIQADGGTRCAAVTGSFIGLCDALNKLKKDGVFDKLPVSDFVAAVSVGIIDGEIYLDLDYEEDSRAEVDMNVIMTGKGDFIEIQGTAEKKPFNNKMMNQMISVAKVGIEELVSQQKKILGKIVD